MERMRIAGGIFMRNKNIFTSYENIASDIRERIEEGFYLPEDRLPSVIELCNEYNASDSTIRKSLNILKKEGYVYSKKRVGVFVSSEKDKRFILKFNEFENIKTPIDSVEILKFDEKNSLEESDERFKNKKYIQCTRIYKAEEFPVIYKTDYIVYNAHINAARINPEKWLEQMDLVLNSSEIKKTICFRIAGDVKKIRDLMILADNTILYQIDREYWTPERRFVGKTEIFVANYDVKLRIFEK